MTRRAVIHHAPIKHPPYFAFSALHIHIQRHLPTSGHGPQHRSLGHATQAQWPLRGVGVAGKRRRRRIIQQPGRALFGAFPRGHAAQSVTQGPARNCRLHRFGPATHLLYPFRQRLHNVLQ
ncbi:hypothetical protein G6F21_014533 [Rhizopus arrhizus]|nr:hypothetical protein G6F21_014533 [Rhizopus arrhizus]